MKRNENLGIMPMDGTEIYDVRNTERDTKR